MTSKRTVESITLTKSGSAHRRYKRELADNPRMSELVEWAENENVAPTEVELDDGFAVKFHYYPDEGMTFPEFKTAYEEALRMSHEFKPTQVGGEKYRRRIEELEAQFPEWAKSLTSCGAK